MRRSDRWPKTASHGPLARATADLSFHIPLAGPDEARRGSHTLTCLPCTERKAWLRAGATLLSYQKPPQDSLLEGAQYPTGGSPVLTVAFGAGTCSAGQRKEADASQPAGSFEDLHRAMALLPRLPLGGNFFPDFIKTKSTPGGPASAASPSVFRTS